MGIGLSDFDPTNRNGGLRRGLKKLDPTTPEGQRNLLYVGSGGMAAIANETLGDPLGFSDRIKARREELEARAAAGDAKAQMELERLYFNELAEKYRGVAGSPETARRADEIYGREMKPEIDAGMYDATSATARGYASRGMGGSGYDTAAQSQAIQAAAQERVRARSRALDIATAEGRSSLTGEASLRSQGTGIATQLYSNAVLQHEMARQRAAQERAQFRQMIAGMGGRIAGAYLGGPVGSQIGGQLGDSLGGGGYGPIDAPVYLDDGMYLEG